MVIVYSNCNNCIVQNMFGQKFNPYSQYPNKSNQLYEDEYEEEDSEPLVEQFQSNYQPTEKEVKEYAIQVLGMNLPQDQGLLYIAREGIKAPLPPNWVPYQSRNGQVYYKHRITQQKTYDHPTDTEYRKKYEQQKQKMARKNLKSMNMKSSAPIGMPQNLNLYGNSASNLIGSKLNNSGLMSASNNVTSNSMQAVAVKLDPKIEEQYEAELRKLQERLKKQWRDFEEEEAQRHETKLRKAKQQYESDLSQLFKNKNEKRIQEKINHEKERIRQRIEQSSKETLQNELREYERQQENKIAEFRTVYEEDNHLKLNKYQQEKIQQFETRQARHQQNLEKSSRLKEIKKKERQERLTKLKQDLQDGTNPQIQAATQEALLSELAAIKENYTNKLKALQNDLQREYQQTKKVLGFDQTAYLAELAGKKSRMKSVSHQKLESYKRKQINAINQIFQLDLQNKMAKQKQKLERDLSQKLQAQRRKQGSRMTRQKEQIDEQIKRKSEIQIQTIYDELKLKSKSYETEMNKKISTLNQKFINDIHGKSRETSRDIVAKLEVKQKQITLQNKQQMIDSLKRQIALQSITYELLKLQQQLYKCGDSHSIDQKLLQLSKKYQMEYRTQNYLKYEREYKQLKAKCKKDKEFLASIMTSLQGTNKHTGIGGMAVLKQYNQDVRLMRQNQQMLRKYQLLLKKAQVNDKLALTQLQKGQFIYKDIQLRAEMGKVHVNPDIHELADQSSIPIRQKPINNHQDIEYALRDHSKFLTSMRHELNRKLYQLRSGWHYS